jgi:putative addiction module component (TIGR02574 family)
MSTNSPDIFDAALNLPDAERASLAYQLLQSLRPPGVVSDGDVGFEAELEQRVTDYEAGKTKASDWDEVAARLRKSFQQRTSS